MKKYTKPTLYVVHLSQERSLLTTSPIGSEQELNDFWKKNGYDDYESQTVRGGIFSGELD